MLISGDLGGRSDMTTKKSAQGLIVTMALCLSATAGRAQDKKFFLMGSATSISDTRSFTEASIPYSSTFATGGRGTLGLEWPLRKSKIFAIEGTGGFGQNNLKLSNLNTSPATTTSYGLRNYRFSGDLVAHTSTGYRGIRPYVLVGAEYDDFSPTSAASALATKQGFAFEPTAKLTSQGTGGVNFGGGIDWAGSRKLGLRLDVRYHSTSAPTFGLPTSQPSTAGLPWFPNTGSAHNIEYSIGIVYHFGREKAPTASTPTPQRPSSRRRSSKPLPSTPPSPF
jgi:outer membrane protein W